MFTTNLSPYQFCKVVNKLMNKNLPPQMFYNYVKKGYIKAETGETEQTLGRTLAAGDPAPSERSVVETAILDATPKAVESRLYRARQILRERLKSWL